MSVNEILKCAMNFFPRFVAFYAVRVGFKFFESVPENLKNVTTEMKAGAVVEGVLCIGSLGVFFFCLTST